MRSPILILLVFLSACAPYPKISGNYFTDNQDCLVLNGKNGLVESRENGLFRFLSLRQTKEKLKFYSVRHMRPPLGFLVVRPDKYFFRVLERKGDSIVVAPISRKAKALYNGKRYLTFMTQDHFDDQTNYFHKIIFHSGRCFGYCDDLHLELDYSGNLKVTNNGNGRGDSGVNLNYFGRVSYQDMDSLRTILRHSQLKTLVWPTNRNWHDDPDHTLIIYQYEKRYYFHANRLNEPVISYELTDFLYNLFKYPALHRVDTTFSYEK